MAKVSLLVLDLTVLLATWKWGSSNPQRGPGGGRSEAGGVSGAETQRYSCPWMVTGRVEDCTTVDPELDSFIL